MQWLHSSGRLHRDLKPSNVLVKADGQVVILDFGLVTELESNSAKGSQLVGSPIYMAPEQAANDHVSEAADWYAVGVILYKAITGRFPFAGSWSEVLARKQNEAAPSCRGFSIDRPEDLEEICQALLQRDPALRANGIDLLLKQGARIAIPTSQMQEQFVGRRTELNLLHERYAAMSDGNRQIVLLEGRSGIGKTSLLSGFLNELQREHPSTVILRGRCRESESLPYKALDPIADALVAYLRSLPTALAADLLPTHSELLRRRSWLSFLQPDFRNLCTGSPHA